MRENTGRVLTLAGTSGSVPLLGDLVVETGGGAAPGEALVGRRISVAELAVL